MQSSGKSGIHSQNQFREHSYIKKVQKIWVNYPKKLVFRMILTSYWFEHVFRIILTAR